MTHARLAGYRFSIVPPTTPVRDRVGGVGIGMQVLFGSQVHHYSCNTSSLERSIKRMLARPVEYPQTLILSRFLYLRRTQR